MCGFQVFFHLKHNNEKTTDKFENNPESQDCSLIRSWYCILFQTFSKSGALLLSIAKTFQKNEREGNPTFF